MLMFECLKAIFILPFNAIIVIPALILYFSDYAYKTPNTIFLIISLLLLSIGIFLLVWTIVLFYNVGKGTLAPWNPPKKIVVKGPYRYVRNPMIIGVLLILIAEYFLLNSVEILYWALLFFVINTIHFYLFEEKQLEKKFKQDYKRYKQNVPMWIPRFKAWDL